MMDCLQDSCNMDSCDINWPCQNSMLSMCCLLNRLMLVSTECVFVLIWVALTRFAISTVALWMKKVHIDSFKLNHMINDVFAGTHRLCSVFECVRCVEALKKLFKLHLYEVASI